MIRFITIFSSDLLVCLAGSGDSSVMSCDFDITVRMFRSTHAGLQLNIPAILGYSCLVTDWISSGLPMISFIAQRMNS